MSKLVGFVSDIYLPPILRTVVIRTMGTMFGVNFSEVLYPLEHFTSWNQFFGRQIIPRPISKTAYSLVAPADSVLLSLQEIHQDSTVLVKGINYSVGNFITGEYNRTFTQKEIDFFRMKKNTKLFSLVFYLAPKDYHRFHSMANCTIFEMVHVAGMLFPVKDSYVTKIKVYTSHPRASTK